MHTVDEEDSRAPSVEGELSGESVCGGPGYTPKGAMRGDGCCQSFLRSGHYASILMTFCLYATVVYALC